MTPRDCYLAMYYFIRSYWERGGKRDGSVTLLVQALSPSRDPSDPNVVMTDDPAFWEDWIAALNQAGEEGFPTVL